MKQPMFTQRGHRLLAIAALLGCGERESIAPVVAPEAKVAGPPRFVADASCSECHAEQAAAWAGSHHDRAMEVADTSSVLGDFSGADPGFGIADGKYLVRAEGADGTRAEFSAPYTFGVAPLQQMLVELPGGRLQSYTTAWDTEKRRWFSLYPGQTIPPGDALHWTGRYQRWNAMCADCHSTGVVKGYDAASDSYRTSWAEIDVGCQACHGPGSAHVELARAGSGLATGKAGGLLVDLTTADATQQVESCAPCHSRRAQIRAEIPYGRPFLDGFLPATLDVGLYHPDGQIDAEVYEYGSFLQSAMYARGVRCSDCHDSHSGELADQGNALCVRCHSPTGDSRFPTLKARDYDTPEHHHHAPGSAGAACADCHMPEKTYMEIDRRRDHSIRVPRPDLSAKLGTPNACNACHADRAPGWAAERVAQWYGPERRSEPHFGEVFAAARAGDGNAIPALMKLADDSAQPTVVRATALGLLEPAGPQITPVLERAAREADPWLRSAAAGACDALGAEARLGIAAPLLSDPVLGVRIEAARVLSVVPEAELTTDLRARIDAGLREFETAQRVQGDLPGAHLNLGVVLANRGADARAEAEYRTALRMDPAFLPASFNLATLLNKMGRNADAETALRDAIRLSPEQGDLHYSLGLLLVEAGKLEPGAESLGRAAALMPERARVHYNHGLALLRSGKRAEAGRALRLAYERATSDPQIVHALALFHAQAGEWASALPLARELVRLAPEDPGAKEMLARIEAELSAP